MLSSSQKCSNFVICFPQILKVTKTCSYLCWVAKPGSSCTSPVGWLVGWVPKGKRKISDISIRWLFRSISEMSCQNLIRAWFQVACHCPSCACVGALRALYNCPAQSLVSQYQNTSCFMCSLSRVFLLKMRNARSFFWTSSARFWPRCQSWNKGNICELVMVYSRADLAPGSRWEWMWIREL